MKRSPACADEKVTKLTRNATTRRTLRTIRPTQYPQISGTLGSCRLLRWSPNDFSDHRGGEAWSHLFFDASAFHRPCCTTRIGSPTPRLTYISVMVASSSPGLQLGGAIRRPSQPAPEIVSSLDRHFKATVLPYKLATGGDSASRTCSRDYLCI